MTEPLQLINITSEWRRSERRVLLTAVLSDGSRIPFLGVGFAGVAQACAARGADVTPWAEAQLRGYRD